MKMATALAAPLLLLLALAAAATAVTFEATNTVPNSAGGRKFEQEVGGAEYAAQVLSAQQGQVQRRAGVQQINGYSDDIFVQIKGNCKSVGELWSEYKAKYSQG